MKKSKNPIEAIRVLLKQPKMLRRIVMTVFGVLICGASCGIFKASALGVDPFQVFCWGMANVVPIPFGTLYTIINIVLLCAMLIADRHYVGLGTLINLFLLGYVVQWSTGLVTALFPNPSLPVRVALLLVAIPIMCLSSALYFTADLGVSTYDVWALLLDKKTRFPFRVLRICTDLCCVVAGFLLLGLRPAGVLGVGTIITALFMGPLVDFFNRKVARPLLAYE